MQEEQGVLEDRGAIIEHLKKEFEIRFGERMFEHAVKALGLVPIKVLPLGAPRRGRVGLYDPVLAWLLASVNQRKKGQLVGLKDLLGPYRLLWDELHQSWQARQIPGFADNREYGAQLLMLTSQEYGMPVADVFLMVREKPTLLTLSGYGPEYLENVFYGYRDATVAALQVLDIKTRPGDPSPEEQKRQFADWWLTATASYMAAPDVQVPSE